MAAVLVTEASLPMLLDPTRFSFIPPIEAAFPVFEQELDALEREDFVAWPDTAAYQGAWFAFPLFFPSFPEGLDRLFGPNQARCPESTRILRSIPRVMSAGFSWMEPGCHIFPHTDQKPENQLRAHLGLRVPEGALMRVGPDRHTWQRGRCLVFDGLVDHETANLGGEPRVVLLVDARLSDQELAYLRSTKSEESRASVSDRREHPR